MEIYHKSVLSMYILSFLSLSFCSAQNAGAIRQDTIAINQTALDYIEGYYSGDVTRVERAIHSDLNKAALRDLSQTGRTIIAYTTHSALIENTRAKVGLLNDTARHIQIHILNIDGVFANVKVISAQFTEFLQLVHFNSQWKIINVLFTSGTGGPPRLRDFKGESEYTVIEQTAFDYLSGLTGADAKRLDLTISPDFSKITIIPIAATGNIALRRQRYESILENTFARIGKQDEIYRNNSVHVLDVTDGLAVVQCETATTSEYVQMFKGSGEWKILNCISQQNSRLTLAKALTVIAGEPMPDFTLPVFNGGEFSLSKFRGKNILLMFPRGWLGNSWCAYCPYQYLELEQLEKKSNIKSNNNLEIAFVLPYSSDRIKDWMEKFPDALAAVENNKNPQPAPLPGSIQADYSEWVKKNFPIRFDVKKDDPHTVIPVLADEERTLSRQVKIFTGFWDGISSEQNMASVFIIDKKGILRFKYIGQMTEDRPSVEYLLNFIKTMK
jgi:peroxiredoxin